MDEANQEQTFTMDEAMLKIIEENPIRDGLDAFRNKFASISDSIDLGSSPDAFDLLERSRRRIIALEILATLQILPATQRLRSASSNKLLFKDILDAFLDVSTDEFDVSRIKPLLKVVFDNSEDAAVWTQVYKAFSKASPSPPPIPSPVASLSTTATTATAAAAADTRDAAAISAVTSTQSVHETPWTRSTASILNSSETRREVDTILKKELGDLRVDIRGFRESFFACVPDLEIAAAAVFDRCREGDEPVFVQEGWHGWPAEAREADVLLWFENITTRLEELAADYRPANLTYRRKLLAQSRTSLRGSQGRRCMDIGFINDDSMVQVELESAGRYHRSHILVPGELKSNSDADVPSKAWSDLAIYVREVFAAQDSRRFVLAFTLCGPYLRLWEFDRLGGMASERFNINEPKGGLEFVAAMLGFLWMDKEGLGFDPRIMESGGKRSIDIERDGKKERLIIDKLIWRSRGITSRGTTCWKAYREDDPQKKPLVIKESWQYMERDEEGLIVKEATEMGVINIARYYHHETVHIGGVQDDIRTSIRKGLDSVAATADAADTMATAASTMSAITAKAKKRSTSSSASSTSTVAAAAMSSSRRRRRQSRLQSVKSADTETSKNRVHKLLVYKDYGSQIYKASSPKALLEALESCIRGHESLRLQGKYLHRDISINNLLLKEDGPVGEKGILIDFDLAIKEQRIKHSGAKGKTGTRAFMAIEVLIGKQHSFMHDLESFFWVLFWICVHYERPNEARTSDFDDWNFMCDRELAGVKMIIIYDSPCFCREANLAFTEYYAPLIPLMDKLRAVVFPNGKPWAEPNEGLYSMMSEILLQNLE
ncbi:hypothetical protein Trco_001313 [Trichoderma cornu-damae]|uniref:EKC/KEOPS complex subunit BUD32 n=1 Tax=Trichoderma cornu-damae TaxID=654480 RepID=A0A9P8QYW1_9HYPO|nr:hypothetical protein Trco_001313 [Trichoderma cornu-damae]